MRLFNKRWLGAALLMGAFGVAYIPAAAEAQPKNKKEKLQEKKEKHQEKKAELKEKHQEKKEELKEKHKAKKEELKQKKEEILAKLDPEKVEKWKEKHAAWKEKRKERREEYQAKVKEKYGDILDHPGVKAELRRHARRMARLTRIRKVAELVEDDKAVAKADELMEKERARHQAKMAQLESAANAKGGR